MAPHGAQAAAPLRPGIEQSRADDPAAGHAAHEVTGEASARIRLARTLCGLAIFLLPACVIATPWGLAPFALLIVPAMLLAPDTMRAAWPRSRALALPLLLLAAFVAAVALASRFGTGVPWDEVDNRARVLVMPLFALAVVAMRPQRAWLWSGAVLGLVAACVVAALEILGGVPRPGGWTNPIVFADVALGLMVVAVFCRPQRRAGWVAVALLAGAAAILLTGSRGAWPGLAAVAVVAVSAGGWRVRFPAWLWLLFAGLLSVMAWFSAPLVLSRMDALQRDAARYDTGDVDSSLGVRLDLVDAAGDAFLAHPWLGVGVGSFDAYLGAMPECAGGSPPAFCRFGHAHSDLPEWAATMGIPGALALIALYGVPLLLFARRLRGIGRCSASAPCAGVLFVATFVLCGLTQSMFAHQLSASFYAVMVGVLAGFCILERAGEAGQG